MNNKKITIVFFVSIIITSIIFIVKLYFTDPLQLFHKQSNQKSLVMNPRHQVAGIINNYNFNSIIIGTSMLENTSAEESSKILGGKFFNLSLSGSDFYTRSIVLDYVLKKKKLKKILFSLDDIGLVNARVSNTSNFDFLYDNNKFNDIKVYISSKYLICSLYNPHCLEDVDIDRPFAWYKIKDYSKRLGGLDNWFKGNSNKQIIAFKEILEIIKKIKLGKTNIEEEYKKNLINSQKYIENTLIKHISKYPHIEFIFVLPPYSRIKYAIDSQYNVSKFYRYKANIEYLINQSKVYSNLKIYGWGNHSFVDDIANYKDPIHYDYKINTWMLSAIKREEGLLTVENVGSYLKIFTKKSLEYDLFVIGNKIDTYLNSK